MADSKKTTLCDPEDALPGREDAMVVADTHAVNGNTVKPPFPDGMEMAMFGMGCFWGAERWFWQQEGVFSTQVGLSGGYTPNPNNREVNTGQTGHSEVVRVVYDPNRVSYSTLLALFWESHDPTQYMQQGTYVGSQYRSGIYYYSPEQKQLAEQTKDAYQQALSGEGLGRIVTDIKEAGPFYYAEDHHQQYLFKNPEGVCGVRGTGVACPRSKGLPLK